MFFSIRGIALLLMPLAVHHPTFAAGAPTCPLSEKELIGAWENVSAGFFQEMAFEYSGQDREFNSWLHQRPEISGGTWTFEDCTIQIRHPGQDRMRFSFRVVRARGDRIYLREAGDKKVAVYKRIK